MPEASVHAVVCDLLGGDPHAPAPAARPTVEEALPGCRPGDVVPARRGREEVALVVLEDGSAYAVPDACPHDGRPLSDGFVDGDRLVCSRHGWEFEPATGRCPGRARACIRAAAVGILDRAG